MAIIKWDPLREFENMFDRYTKAMGYPSNRGQEFVTGDWSPSVDISETEEEFNIKAEIPEVNKEDVKINIEEGILTIQGVRNQEKEEKGKKFHRIERCYGTFVRRFSLPSNIDESKIKASFKDGMLTLQVPKIVEPKSKAIEVKIE